MFSFLIAVALLILGFLIYGKIVDRNFAPECLGLLWKRLEIAYNTYYPIGIVLGIMLSFCFAVPVIIASKKRKV